MADNSAGSDRTHVSESTRVLASYIAGALDRDLPAEVSHRAKLHILDSLAAIVSGSRLKAGRLAARYVESLGGKPQAMVVGTKILTSTVNAAMANAMAAHADETDDTNPIGPVHLGCGAVPAALAMGEHCGRSGTELLRAVTLAYDIGARVVSSLGVGERSTKRSPSPFGTTFVAAAAAAAMLRLDEGQVRHVLAYATQQASGTPIWKRDSEHVQKAFDFGGAGARNGVMAATMVAHGMSGVADAFTGNDTFFTAHADNAQPERLTADLGSHFAVFDTTIKKWAVGAPLLAVLEAMTELLKQPAVNARNVASITVHMPSNTLRIVDNSTIPDLCLQHLVALMIVDRGATFKSVHDVARMGDPDILAIRKLVTLIPSQELQEATPKRQAIIRVDTTDGQSCTHHTKAVRGTPANPMDASEVEVKARDLVEPVLGADRTSELISTILNLESVGAVSDLRKLLQA
jgi:2-methylcitrate dehydratase PrpD